MTPDLATLFGLAPAEAAMLAAAAGLAGLVRGFAGFGSALIYIPLAATVLPPIWVILTLTVMDMIGPLPVLPAALRAGRPRQVAALGAVAALAIWPGLWALDRLEGDGFRWVVAGLCLLTVALMASGWRWSGRITPPVVLASGGLSGFLGGLSGLAGPPVILTYLAAPLPAATIRANVLAYLVLWDVILFATFWVQDRLEAAPLLLGAALIPPYLTASLIGARLFRPGREGPWRATAYVLIAAAALAALPVWSAR